jgi:hypothetical protein
MATISIEIDERDEARVFAAIAKNFNWKDRVPNPSFDPNRPLSPSNPREIDNPQPIEDFVNDILRNFLQEHVTSCERKEARKQVYREMDTQIRAKKKKRR